MRADTSIWCQSSRSSFIHLARIDFKRIDKEWRSVDLDYERKLKNDLQFTSPSRLLMRFFHVRSEKRNGERTKRLERDDEEFAQTLARINRKFKTSIETSCLWFYSSLMSAAIFDDLIDTKKERERDPSIEGIAFFSLWYVKKTWVSPFSRIFSACHSRRNELTGGMDCQVNLSCVWASKVIIEYRCVDERWTTSIKLARWSTGVPMRRQSRGKRKERQQHAKHWSHYAFEAL